MSYQCNPPLIVLGVGPEFQREKKRVASKVQWAKRCHITHIRKFTENYQENGTPNEAPTRWMDVHQTSNEVGYLHLTCSSSRRRRSRTRITK